MEAIQNITIKSTHETCNQQVTLEIPIQATLNRRILFPDFGIEIAEGTPRPAEITQEHIAAEKDVGRMVAKELIQVYPELLDTNSEEEIPEEVAGLYVNAWINSIDLDLTNFHGIHPRM